MNRRNIAVPNPRPEGPEGRANHARLAPLLLLIAGVGACGTSDSAFEPGVAVGIRAELIDNANVVSEEVEIGLHRSIESVALRSPALPLAPPALRSANPRIPSDSGFEARKRQRVEALSFDHKSSPTYIQSGEQAAVQPDTMRTLAGGMVCWTALFESVGSLTKAVSVTEILYYTGDGIFAGVTEATSIKLPTTLGFISAGTSFGCVQSPDGDTVSVDYLESLLGIHFTYNIGIASLGATVFYGADTGFERGFQVIASAEKASASFFPGLTFDIVVDFRGGFLVRPTQLIDNDPRTVTEAALPDEENPFKQIVNATERLSKLPANDFRAKMLQEHALLISPTLAMLADTTGSAPAQDRPAVSMADFFAHFVAQGDVYICKDCPNTSLDGIMAQMERDIVATDGDGQATRDAVLGGFFTYRNSTPDAKRLAFSQRQSASAVKFSTLALGDLAAEQRGDDNRFVSDEIVELSGKVGENVVMEISAQEIADLLRVESAAIEGAQVKLDGSPRFGVSTFVMQEGVVKVEFDADDVADLLFVVSVDLSAAAGSFPADVGDWTVRPALRRLRAEAGPVEHLFVLTVPNAKAQAPVQLQAMLTDAHGAPVASGGHVRFYDADDHILGEARAVDGVATIETSDLRVSTPQLLELRQELILVSGEETPGYILAGDGISRDAEIFVGGSTLTEAGGISGYSSSEEILLYFEDGLPPGSYQLFVRNPGGQQSEKLHLHVD